MSVEENLLDEEPINDEALPEEQGESAEDLVYTESELAKAAGWKDKDEYRGPPEKWKPASEFWKTAQENLPVMRQNMRQMAEARAQDAQRVADLERKLIESSKTFDNYLQFAKKQQDLAYKQAKQDLEAKMAEAVENADGRSYALLRQKQEDLDAEIAERSKVFEAPKQEPVKTESSQPQVDPQIKSWVSKNAWYETDNELKQEANAWDAYLINRHGDNMSLEQRLNEVEKHIKTNYAHKFPQGQGQMNGKPLTARPAANTVASPASPARTKKEKSYDDIPEEGKAVYKELARRDKSYTKEQFAKEFWS